MTKLEFQLIRPILLPYLLLLPLLINCFLHTIFLLLILDNETDFWWTGGFLLPPLDFVVVDYGVGLVAGELGALVG